VINCVIDYRHRELNYRFLIIDAGLPVYKKINCSQLVYLSPYTKATLLVQYCKIKHFQFPNAVTIWSQATLLGGESGGGRGGADASSDYILFTKWRTQTSHLKGDRCRPSGMVTCTMDSKTRKRRRRKRRRSIKSRSSSNINSQSPWEGFWFLVGCGKKNKNKEKYAKKERYKDALPKV